MAQWPAGRAPSSQGPTLPVLGSRPAGLRSQIDSSFAGRPHTGRERKDAPQHRQESGAPNREGVMRGMRKPGASSTGERLDSRERPA